MGVLPIMQTYRLAWRGLLALLLVPVVVFSNPTQASAAASSWGTAHVVMDSMTPDGNCWVSAAYDGTDRVKWANGACWGGLDISPFSGQFAEAGSGVRVAFNGATPDGSYCGAVSSDMELGAHGDDGATVAGSIPDGTWGLSGGGQCDVVEVCIGLNSGGSAWITDCAPITLPDATPTTTCPAGSPVSVIFREDNTGIYADDNTGSIWRNSKLVYVTLDWEGGTLPTYNHVLGYYDANGNMIRDEGWSASFRDGQELLLGAVGDGVQYVGIQSSLNYSPAGVTPPRTQEENTTPRVWPSYSPTLDPARPYFGKTDDARCYWWSGDRIVTDSNGTADDPWIPISEPGGGGGTTEPAPAPEPETDAPIGDEPSFWEFMRDALRSMASALASVATAVGKVAGAILGGLADLFVPNPDTWGWRGLVDQVEERPPASIVAGAADSVTSVADGFNGAGGCGILADFSDDDMDAQITCASVKSVEGYGGMYALVQLAMFMFTGLGIFKMFTNMLADGQ